MSDEHIAKNHNRTLLLYHLVFHRNIEGMCSFPRIKKDVLWGGNLWTSGYYANTVGLYASKDTIKRYIQNQGKKEDVYKKLYECSLS